MKLTLGVFLAFSQASARLYERPPPPPPHHLSPREHEAFAKMEEVCQADVERHCVAPEEAMADPIMQWLMAPERLAPPIMHPEALEPMDPINIGPLLDHMMDAALRMPMIIQPQEPTFFLIIDTTPLDEESSDEVVFDSMVSRLMQQSDCQKSHPTEEETVHDVTHHLRLKGQQVLEEEDAPEDRRRLARRLTEVNPEEILGRWQRVDNQPWNLFQSREHHHICPRKHKCLMEAHQQGRLLPECAGAVTRLQKIQDLETKQRENMDLYMNMFWFYCILFCAFFTMTLIRKFKSGKGLFFLRLRILQAVYSNPEIKAKVEDEVGVPLGHVPPVPSVALKMMSQEGRSQCQRKRQRFCHMLFAIMAFFTLDAFGVLPECWPLFVMGACCVFMVVRIVNICFKKPEVRECKCCCCGGSTTDVAEGTVTEAQACCSCCKGSGICSVKCSTCCGTGGKKGGAGSCCGGSCNCAKDNNCDGSCGCCGGSEVQYKLLAVEDCSCCCCGASSVAASQGLLTGTQACCNCCKGTGVCSEKCKACCGSDCCGKGCDCCGDDKEKVTLTKDCSCCCCGASSVAASQGLLTDAQACCNCCKGTGVCSEKCKSCCGSDCCGKGCDCCGDDKKNVTLGPNVVVYHGVPVQIV